MPLSLLPFGVGIGIGIGINSLVMIMSTSMVTHVGYFARACDRTPKHLRDTRIPEA